MEVKKLTQLFETKQIKKGVYYKLVFAKTQNGYTKTTTTKVRFVNYYNIKSVKESGKKPSDKPNPNVVVIIPHILTYNKNTKNYLVHCYKTPHGKAQSTYTDPSGEQIDKATYELAVPPKKHSGDSPVYQIMLQDIIQIG